MFPVNDVSHDLAQRVAEKLMVAKAIPKSWADMPKPLDWAAGAVPSPMSASDAASDLAKMDVSHPILPLYIGLIPATPLSPFHTPHSFPPRLSAEIRYPTNPHLQFIFLCTLHLPPRRGFPTSPLRPASPSSTSITSYNTSYRTRTIRFRIRFITRSTGIRACCVQRTSS